MGALTEGQLELEVARGVYDRDELIRAVLPWQMTDAGVIRANAIVRSVKIPAWKGGRLPVLYTESKRFVKMSHWHIFVNDLGIWVLQQAQAFPRPEILDYWCRVFLHRGHRGLDASKHTEEHALKLDKDGRRLNNEWELRFPSRANTMTLHYDTHDAEQILLAGPRQARNMYNHERVGSYINKGGHSACHLESSMMKRWQIKEIVGFLKYHDPNLFRFAPVCHKNEYVRPPSDYRKLKNPTPGPLSCHQLKLLEETYARTDVHQQMHELLHGSELSLADLSRPGDAMFSRVLQSPKRTFEAVARGSGGRPWEEGSSVIKFKSDKNEPARYGLILNVFSHICYRHTKAPSFVFLELHTLQWERGPFLDRVKLPVGVDRPGFRGDRMVFYEEVQRWKTICLLPAVAADLEAGFSHNAVHIP